MDFRNDIKIDPNALDLEWRFHADKHTDWREELAIVDDKIRRKKTYISNLEADVKDKIRLEVEQNNGKMPTAPIMEAMINKNSDLRLANAELNDLLFERDMLSVADKGMYDKKSALENLVKLMLGNYFAAPKEPKDLSRANDKYDNAARKNKKNMDEVKKELKERREGKEEFEEKENKNK